MGINTLKLKRIGIDTYHEHVAYLHRQCETYRAEGFQALSKIKVTNGGTSLLAVLNVVDDSHIVGMDELGLSEQAYEKLNPSGDSIVTINHAEPPNSMDAVRRKIMGERLDYEDFIDITQDIADGRYSKMEMAAFLVSSSQTGLDRDEILHLTKAMVASGHRMEWDESIVVDKHCIGGIPGNRTSMLVVPIVSAHGLLIPKTSSRAITSPAGTADTMELFADVNLSPQRLRQIIDKERGCLVWGGTAHLAPVDDLMIAVERPLSIDSRGQMVASILSKKIAAGSSHLLIDIPVGATAKVRHMRQALALRKLFEFVGDHLDIHVEVLITNGEQPIGCGIGPVLEAKDIMLILKNDPAAPSDLREKSLQIAGRIIEFDPDVRGGQGYLLAKEILESGRAQRKMNAIIQSQGGKPLNLTPGQLSFEVCSIDSGVVASIDNFQLAKIARLAGAPMDKKAGVAVLKKVGEVVTKNEPLFRIHAEFPADFQFAIKSATDNSGYTITTDL